MATVYKQTRRKPIPRGAEIIDYRGRRYAVWTSRGKRERRAPLTDDGQAVEIADESYTVEWFSWDGKRKRLAGGRDKDAAKALGVRMEDLERQRRQGLIDPRQERLALERKRSLETHLADYEAKLRAANRTDNHVDRTLGFIRGIVAAAGFATVADITADGVNAYAGELGQKRSARTVAAHLTAIKSFTRWLAVNGKLPSDPLASVQKPNPKAARKHQRRMLLPEEWDWLRTVTLADNAERDGMAAGERVLLYATAIQTGLRSGELRSLTRGRLYLDAARPYIVCKAGSTKNQQDAQQYIQADLAAELREHVARKAPVAPVFAMPAAYDVAAMLRADLDATRREWLKAAEKNPQERLRREQSDFLAVVNHEGEALDFHALRHTCGAWASMNGASPKAVQALMRHSSIVLTMDTYGHLLPSEEAQTVQRLPNMMGDGPEALRATGTCDARVAEPDANGAAIGAAVGAAVRRPDIPDLASVGGRGGGEGSQEGLPEVVSLPRVNRSHGEKRPVTAGFEGSRPGRDRTCDQGIMSPLLSPLSYGPFFDVFCRLPLASH